MAAVKHQAYTILRLASLRATRVMSALHLVLSTTQRKHSFISDAQLRQRQQQQQYTAIRGGLTLDDAMFYVLIRISVCS